MKTDLSLVIRIPSSSKISILMPLLLVKTRDVGVNRTSLLYLLLSDLWSGFTLASLQSSDRWTALMIYASLSWAPGIYSRTESPFSGIQYQPVPSGED